MNRETEHRGKRVKSYNLKFTVCPKCGSHNWIATDYGANCLSCDWKYHGDIYLEDKKEEIEDTLGELYLKKQIEKNQQTARHEGATQ